MFKIFFMALVSMLLSACTTVPVGVTPVDNFNLSKYQGKWYEVARLDHSFERGLEQVTAEYQLMPEGHVKVTNRGYSTEDETWNEAIGKAKFVESKNIGFLEVSFFGPFYGSYIIFNLDEQYQHSFVAGPNTSYLWLLSRTPNPDKTVIDKFLKISEKLGFDTSSLIFPEHSS
ncbi:lipocalin [Litorilituus lipolyticus]|uniref:Outer membrane lipoprotein Blc n=2 Tax=Litorilituus lipolyticus TaxID=2491017 RepID=A0A502KKX2_9GAMM|nr:lipocalin family protein [Litorilituus lipolyticus]TPH12270.1 lipocalin [Litorilituus lipolyticus]